MRVLLQNRLDALECPGGDTILMLQLQKHLKDQGIQADLGLELRPKLGDYDLVHLFNISRVHETFVQAKHAKSLGKRIVLSSIYHDCSELDRKGRTGFRRLARFVASEDLCERAKTFVRAIRDPRQSVAALTQARMGFKNQQVAVTSLADIVMVCSLEEREALRKRIAFSAPCEVIPYGISSHFAQARPDWFVQQYGIKDFVLCVARIEEVKNQAALLEAIQGTGLQLVLVGRPSANSKGYCRLVLKRARQQGVLHIETLTEQELGSAYAAAKVHVLPSWIESAGLVSFEAALAGCRIVTTNRTFARQDLDGHVWYCSPDDIGSIRSAILEAYDALDTSSFREHILANLTWERIAPRVAEVYRKACAGT
jgi:glycosyltransferase involved in cell wall biosynthesis